MSEIIRRLEYIARVLDTPPYNTPDEVKAIREVIDCVNRYDSLVARAEKLSNHINKFQRDICMDSKCCPDDVSNCAECVIKHF